MKSRSILLYILLFVFADSNAQITDTTLKKKLSISGFCLCQTNLSELKLVANDLKEVELEEMDLAKGCYGQDSRFIAGKGYASSKYPGLIFQQEPESEYISKIRLTRQFSGQLPDGKTVNLGEMTLRDLFKMYPTLKNKWGSRGCSDYWNFSNDTLSFYVRINQSKKPQFPVDEAYYLDKPIEAADFMISCYSLKKRAEENITFVDESKDPMFFLDSIKVNKGVLMNYQPEEIASMTVVKGSNAVKLMGAEAKNGLIYIETKDFARNRYWNYFKSKSADYKRIVQSSKDNSTIQYILNTKVLSKNFEADLAALNDKTFIGITIINKDQLIKDYDIHDKEIGIVITSVPAVSKK